MKIVHIGPHGLFTEGMTYQDNLLSEQNIKDGHDVYYITNCFLYTEGKPDRTHYGETRFRNGLRVIRLPGNMILGDKASLKIGYLRGLGDVLERIAPDILMYHGMYGFGLLEMSDYKAHHPTVKLYGDIHANSGNSGSSALSLWALHRIMNKALVQNSLSLFDRIFYIAAEEREFACKNWCIPKSRMESLPLGGTILSDTGYREARNIWRRRLGIAEGELLFFHSGKIDSLKRTDILIDAFSKTPNPNASLVIAGSIEEGQDAILSAAQKDDRIKCLNWADRDELLGYLCAADVYVQPGSVSATFQNALCCRCAGIAYPHLGYKELFGNAIWYAKDMSELVSLFERISNNQLDVLNKQKEVFEIAKRSLDYRQLARRLYE